MRYNEELQSTDGGAATARRGSSVGRRPTDATPPLMLIHNSLGSVSTSSVWPYIHSTTVADTHLLRGCVNRCQG